MPADFELVPGTRTVHSLGIGHAATRTPTSYGHIARIAALLEPGVLDGDWAPDCRFRPRRQHGRVSLNDRRSTAAEPIPLAALRRPAFVVATDERFRLLRMYRPSASEADDVGITRSVADAEDFIARERARLGIAV